MLQINVRRRNFNRSRAGFDGGCLVALERHTPIQASGERPIGIDPCADTNVSHVSAVQLIDGPTKGACFGVHLRIVGFDQGHFRRHNGRNLYVG